MTRKIIRSIFWAFLLIIISTAIAALVMPAPSVCRTCGMQIASTLWMIGMAAVFPAIWIDGPRFLQRLYASSIAAASGIAVYWGLEFAAMLFISVTENLSMGLVIGFTSNLLGLGAAFIVSRALMNKYASKIKIAEEETAKTLPG